ncbi:hypothetical protein CYMTET_30572 [Cymbomonas tetramitiformis]|uniref:UBC core domain-containing protein n=1 Tax=Cymbomonas tetramitiformis TaxID=36881 RepID=A0AAE0FIQ3_9CHLO|nr:hypothetical protein CYMTET_30572 [Cymbomonas tetramitiformis]
MAQRRICRELDELEQKPLSEEPKWTLTKFPTEENPRTAEATVEGPTSSPYAGGRFKLQIQFPSDYPFKPPKVYFKTNMYHMHVTSDTGSIACALNLTDQGET